MSDHWIFVLRPELRQPSPHQAETDDGIVTTNCTDLPFQPCHLRPYQGPEPGRCLGDQARIPTDRQEAFDVEREAAGWFAFPKALAVGGRELIIGKLRMLRASLHAMGEIDLKEQTGIPVFVPAHSTLAHHRVWEKPNQVVVTVQEPQKLYIYSVFCVHAEQTTQVIFALCECVRITWGLLTGSLMPCHPIKCNFLFHSVLWAFIQISQTWDMLGQPGIIQHFGTVCLGHPPEPPDRLKIMASPLYRSQRLLTFTVEGAVKLL